MEDEKAISLYGRDGQLDRIRVILERTENSESAQYGSVIMLSGASGTGKSTLAESILAIAKLNNFDCFRTACEPFHEGMSYFPVRELVRQVSRGVSVGDVISEQFGKGSPEAEMAAVSDSVSADPASRREAIVATFSNVIMGGYQTKIKRPKILFIDDLEHLDAGSADALICLISRLSEGPVVILGAFRSDLVAETKHPLKSVITSARRIEGVFHGFEIEGFGENEFLELLEAQLLGPVRFPPSVTRRLYEETEGNPLFSRELIRMLSAPDPKSGRVSIRNVDGLWKFEGDASEWHIPETVEEVIASRLDFLEVSQRRELELAAVVGRRFAFRVLQSLTESGENELLEDLEKFLDVDLIRELESTDETFEFSHGKIRDVLYAQLSGLRRRRLHAQVASVLASIRSSSNENWDALIGDHLLKADKTSEAFPYLLRAARSAQSIGAATESVSLYEKLMKCTNGAIFEENDSKSTIQLEQVGACIGASEIALATSILSELISTDQPSEVRVKALNLQGDIFNFEGKIDSALESYLESWRIAEAIDDKESICEVLCDLAELHGRQYERQSGIVPESAESHRLKYVECVDRAYGMASTLSQGQLKARVYRNKAKLSRVTGDFENAERLYRAAIDTVDRRVSSHRFLIPYAKCLRRAGKGSIALEHIERILAWSVQVGSTRSQAIGLQYKATIMMTTDPSPADLDVAMACAEKSLVSHQLIGYAQGIRETQIVLGEIALRRGDQSGGLSWFALAVGDEAISGIDAANVVAVELRANGEEDRAQYLASLWLEVAGS